MEMMDNIPGGGGMDDFSWFSRFRELVLSGYTVTAIRDQLSLEGFDLSEFEDTLLIKSMVKILTHKEI